jgi:hypothetical protein
MTNYPYLLFNQSPEQLRRIGARGGHAQARNRRARQQAQELPPHPPAGIHLLVQTTAQASRVLDARFPWLRGAGKRRAPGRPQPIIPPRLGRRNALCRRPEARLCGGGCPSVRPCSASPSRAGPTWATFPHVRRRGLERTGGPSSQPVGPGELSSSILLQHSGR